ncbi:fatty acyl-CoA reductase wat-like isoform X3 [Odontomachus brunneus]|uniref:fatty acyl-CoA reductase wat-like isoform X3 n=1 Tax=Odontomachus brunneus TaxID=486640 RepID=UPI0013F1972F|nr:fatty acyl-CoA reductase wat-like isoform X3 [Odontomachus brunneus]
MQVPNTDTDRMSDDLLDTNDSNQSKIVHCRNKTNIQETQIQKFYANQTIFITGGTGFLGKVLIEKLLRSCPNISKIYVVIRSKKHKSATSRLVEIFESSLFDRLREETPNFRDKVVPLVQVNELYEKNLGLTKDDIDLVINKVSIIFHLAATVRFNEDIKVAAKINVYGTYAILNLAKRMPNLKSFIHVSTITAHCLPTVTHIEECFYKYTIESKEFLTLMRTSSENTIDEKILRAAAQWPNTYTFTKAIAEVVIRDSSESLPIGIFRPSIVMNTVREPLVGWIDNYYGPIGVTVSIAKGLTRFFRADSDCLINFVPADITINALIAAAWDVFNQPQKRGDKMIIYNSVSTNDAPLFMGDYTNHIRLNVRKYPTKHCYWMPTITLVKNKIIYKMCIWFGHLLPALFIQIFQQCIGARQRIWKLYNMIHKYQDAVSYFTLHNWIHSDDNIQAMWRSMDKNDQCLFDFNMKGFDWSKYLDDHFKGVRLYLLKDDLSTLENSRIKLKRLYWIHQVTKFLLTFIVFMLVWKLF